MRGDTSDVKRLKVILTSVRDHYWTGVLKAKVGKKIINCQVTDFMPLSDQGSTETILRHLREILQAEYGEE